MKRFLLLAVALLVPVLTLHAADYAVTAANVIPSVDATIARGTAGATITQGQSVCKDTDGLIKLYDANGAGNLHIFAGIACSGASSGQPIVYVTSDPALTPGFTVAAGACVIGSATPGSLCPVADLATGHYLTVVGVGIGSNKIILAPLAAGVATP